MNHYTFHAGDYLSATKHLSWEEDCAHRRLLDAYYTGGGPLPADLRAVYRLVMATTVSQREAVQVVLQEFFDRTDDGWLNRRADAEIALMRDRQQKQRDKAKKRWNGAEKPQPVAAGPAAHKQNAVAAQDDRDIQHTSPAERASAASVAWALKRAGLQRSNPDHPKLLELTGAGATKAHFLDAWADAKAKDSADAFDYVLGVVEGRLRDAAMAAARVGKIAAESADLGLPAPIERNSMIVDVDLHTAAIVVTPESLSSGGTE